MLSRRRRNQNRTAPAAISTTMTAPIVVTSAMSDDDVDAGVPAEALAAALPLVRTVNTSGAPSSDTSLPSFETACPSEAVIVQVTVYLPGSSCPWW